ncbi:hypothetical protein QQ045_019217 [Rhodiola kirilowii]
MAKAYMRKGLEQPLALSTIMVTCEATEDIQPVGGKLVVACMRVIEVLLVPPLSETTFTVIATFTPLATESRQFRPTL